MKRNISSSNQSGPIALESLERRQLFASVTPQSIAGDVFDCRAAAAQQELSPSFNITFNANKTFALQNTGEHSSYSASGNYTYTPTPANNSGKLTLTGSDADGSVKFTATLLFRASPLFSSMDFDEVQAHSGLSNSTSGSASFAFGSAAAAPPGVSLRAKTLSTGTTFYSLSVTYTGTSAIDTSTLSKGDILITGPNGYRQYARFMSQASSTNGRTVTATYRITPTTSRWLSSADGTYHVYVRPHQITDQIGHSVIGELLGSFKIMIA